MTQTVTHGVKLWQNNLLGTTEWYGFAVNNKNGKYLEGKPRVFRFQAWFDARRLAKKVR